MIFGGILELINGIKSMSWKKIDRSELGEWDKKLLCTDASVFQYPYWNESLRNKIIHTHYICYYVDGVPNAYACILSFGLLLTRIGVVRRGPINLIEGASISKEAVMDLQVYARKRGYIFLRFSFTGEADDVVKKLNTLKSVRKMDGLPFYRDLESELIVKQQKNDSDMLMSFQPIARREIKKAKNISYQIIETDSIEEFRNSWYLFDSLSARKGFTYRSLDSYITLIRHAKANKCVRLYTAYFNQCPVEAVLIIRDRDSSYYLSGALDIESLPNKQLSPSCLLQWNSMRDFFQDGVKHHNLGTRSGKVYQFKKKFRPEEISNSPPLTMVLNKPLFKLWLIILSLIGDSILLKIKNIMRRIIK